MPDNLLQSAGTGGVGAIIGTIMSFFGFKGQIKAIDKRVDGLTNAVQFKTVCDARYEDLKGDTTLIRDDMKDIRDDIKLVLGKL